MSSPLVDKGGELLERRHVVAAFCRAHYGGIFSSGAPQGGDDEIPTVGETTMVGPLLALLVDVHLEEGNLDGADRAAQRLARIAEAQRGPYLRAAAALAKGRVCVASGHPDARSCLHSALESFTRAQLPMELATMRLEMARALAAQLPEAAIAAAKAALEDLSASRPLGTPTRPARCSVRSARPSALAPRASAR